MANRIIQRHDTSANWDIHNPILAEGELGFISDQNNRYKIGDGVTPWKSLKLQGFNGNIVTETGDDEGSVMSQKGVTTKFTELSEEINGNNKVSFAIEQGKEVSPYIQRHELHIPQGDFSARFVDNGLLKYSSLSLYLFDADKNVISQHTIHRDDTTITSSSDVAYIGIYVASYQMNSSGNVLIEFKAEGLYVGLKEEIKDITPKVAEIDERVLTLEDESSHLTLEGAKEILVEKKYYNFIVGETYNVIFRNAISADTIQLGDGYTMFGIAAYNAQGKISDLVTIFPSMIPTMSTSYPFTIPSGTEYLKVVGRCDIGTTIDMLFTIVPKDVVESIEAVASQLNKTERQLLSFQVEGNDTTLVFSDIKKNIVPGHRYRVYIKNTDIDMSGVGNLTLGYPRLSILSYDAANIRTKLIVEVPVPLPLLPYYDVVLPEDSEGLGLAIRATKGEILNVYVEDVTISLTNAEKLIYEATGEVPMGNMNPGFYTGGSLNSFSPREEIRSWLVPVKAGKLYHLKGRKVRGNIRLYNSEGNEILKDTGAYFPMSWGENLKMPIEYGEGLRIQITAELNYGEIPEDIKLYEDIVVPQMPIEGDFSLDMESVEYDGKVGSELQATKFTEIYSRYDALVSAYPNNMSKELLGYGTATDGTADTTLPIYEYTFNPLLGHDKNQIIYEGEIPFPNYTKKIILTSGVHGREKISVEAVYKFMENVCKGENSQFASLASNFVIKVIPLVNPFSYDDFSRLNKRGVNINRNLGYSWDNQDIHDATDKGSAAYSEMESQILRDWLRENSDAILFIDAHDSMYSSQYADVAAYVCSADDDILKLGASHIKVESRKVWNDNPSLAKKIYGFIASQKGAVTYWEGASVGIKASSIIEINDYFFNNEMFNQYAIELHCWAVYNWILANIQYALKK